MTLSGLHRFSGLSVRLRVSVLHSTSMKLSCCLLLCGPRAAKDYDIVISRTTSGATMRETSSELKVRRYS